ncbi:aldolase [Ornithinimicrobium ciconiae]|uniref:Aldolase n=1 Tax=Ornithinimicrobium ciconiae TaxID=2594265 RepID=A0A516G6K6_9MICO|nr:aldolase [Ornithinimicrobium ciconiae]QDO87161.1 aldolase [Ornithinimicrobium ciconiae]
MDLLGPLTAELDELLADADAALARHYPGERAGRQPVHTLYLPADRFQAGSVADLGAQASQVLAEHEQDFLTVIDGDEDLLARVRAKIETEPIEDLRIDFEDGYGTRPDEEEDAAAQAGGRALATLLGQDPPPFTGIRIRSFEPESRARGVRTLLLFLEALGQVPDGFVVTLPKVTAIEQVAGLAHACQRLEAHLGGRLQFEVQVETPQSVLGADGRVLLAPIVTAAEGRLTGFHYGTYDYSAACGIAAGQQSLDHPAADHAKAVMQVAAAGTGVRLSDGSTNRLPVGDHLVPGWQEHLRLIRRSLERGFYQGWDLHPAQLPTRYAATYRFFRDGFPAAAQRLHTYVSRQESAILDEPATARALSDFVARGLDCGALEESEVVTATGLQIGTLWAMARRPREGERA